MDEHKDKQDMENGAAAATERLWNNTVKTFHNATFKANQYKRIVQKKIDLNAIQKKIGTAHADLGKLIDDLRSAGERAILSKPDVKAMFSLIDALKDSATTLVAEIEAIKAEEEPHDTELPPEEMH